MLHADSAWILTDGKAGDETQCLGLAAALGIEPQLRRIAPRAPWAWLMPWGPIDPREAPGRPESPIAPPFPDLLIASGRRAVPYLRHIKHASGGRTFTVYLKDPRTGASTADFIWVGEHDRLRGENVMTTLTPPHRISAARITAARAAPPEALAALPLPRAAVLVGGDSRHHTFTPADIAGFVTGLKSLRASGVSLMITASRRTPPALRTALAELAEEENVYLWDGCGDNPYVPMLALADAVVVTADSTNMAGEAAVTGRPVLVFEPSGGHPRLKALLEGLRRAGIVHVFRGRLEGSAYQPLDSTPSIAEAVARAYEVHRRRILSSSRDTPVANA